MTKWQSEDAVAAEPAHTKVDEDPWYLRQDIVSTYEGWYEGKGRRADVLEKELLQWLLSGFGDSQTLLEVGCGTGHFTRWFATLGRACVGLDISPLMLSEAKQRWDGSLIRGSSSELPFLDSSFDIVAFIACMEYMPNPVSVLQEARRIARQGVIWGIMNRWSLPTIRRRIQVALGKNPFYQNAHFFSLREAKRLIHLAYDDANYEVRWKTTVFPRILPLKNSSLPFGALLGISIIFHR